MEAVERYESLQEGQKLLRMNGELEFITRLQAGKGNCGNRVPPAASGFPLINKLTVDAGIGVCPVIHDCGKEDKADLFSLPQYDRVARSGPSGGGGCLKLFHRVRPILK